MKEMKKLKHHTNTNQAWRFQKFSETSFWFWVSDSWETVRTTFRFCKFWSWDFF